MAKVSLNKITPIKGLDKKNLTINGENITVIQYLPMNEKVLLTERVIASALDAETNYISRSRLEVYILLEIIKTYTNINITDKMLEEAPKTYDVLKLNGILDAVVAAIPEQEYKELMAKIYDDSDHLENYLHSFAGMARALALDYGSTQIDIDGLTQQVKDPNTLAFLKDVLQKMG